MEAHYPEMNSRRLSDGATYSDPWASSLGTTLGNNLVCSREMEGRTKKADTY